MCVLHEAVNTAGLVLHERIKWQPIGAANLPDCKLHATLSQMLGQYVNVVVGECRCQGTASLICQMPELRSPSSLASALTHHQRMAYSLSRCRVLTHDLPSLHHSPEGIAVDSDIPIRLYCHIFIKANLSNMGAAEHHTGDVAVV